MNYVLKSGLDVSTSSFWPQRKLWIWVFADTEWGQR